MKNLIVIALLGLSLNALGQSSSIRGNIFNEEGKPISFSTAVLLNPVDSTMEFYGITNKQGEFEIKNIKKGNYLLQIAYLGYETIYKSLKIPEENIGNIGTYIMKYADQNIDEVEINADYVPLRIKKDTIEYNASAFKTKQDAVVEDLLRKLPGIKVDRAGNIKALGVDVTKLLVDGKEFFGNDPKVATKNLPADAVDKVQVYDKKSDESEFTGIDDGTRDKTINLKLKDDKKNSLFGDITAGYGTDDHYKASAKAYRFNDKIQFAGLGMINNINQFGFSFGDYMNFNGGVMSLMSGHGSGKIMISDDNNFPVNFGQPITGLFTSGAGGFNFSHSKGKHNRFFISYLANGSDKSLEQRSISKNFTASGSFLQKDSLKENIYDEAHRINLGYRNRIDSGQNLIINGGLTLSRGNKDSKNYNKSLADDILINTQNYFSNDAMRRIQGTFYGSYMKKFNKNRTIFKLSSNVFYSQNLNKTNYDNLIWYAGNDQLFEKKQFQNNNTDKLNYSLSTYITQKTKNIYYFVPEISIGSDNESLDRLQGTSNINDELNDTVDIRFNKQYQWFRPGFSLKRNTKKTQFSVSLKADFGQLGTTLKEDQVNTTNYWYLTPGLYYEYEYKTGRRISFNYNSMVQTPTSDQLLPVVNDLNPLSVFQGNPNLKPEYKHDANLSWWIFDQFSFTSLMTGLNASYTFDKINWSSTINEQLEQSSTLINVEKDFVARANIDFSTAIRKLGVKINLNLEETFNQGINYVNEIENEITNYSHQISFSVENRKKKKLDLVSGIGTNIQNATYSLQTSLNRQYLDLFWFGEIRYDPNDKWHFEITADVTNYSDQSFEEAFQVPLINAEMSYRFLKNNRGALILNAFDLLNQNTGIRRMSELNYLREIQSNTIGRYVMLSFKFRINKFDNKSGIDIQINKRH